MRKIKATKLADVTHITSAKLKFTGDDGIGQEDSFQIDYRGLSPKVARELDESATGENRVEMAKYLAKAVKCMPEVVDDDEQPVAITFEFFDAMETDNLRSIFDAVQEGYNGGGPTQPISSEAS
jgi:hypothetical protein